MTADPKKKYFPDDSYKTPGTTVREWGDRFLMGSRWWFHYRFLRIVLKSRSFAVKGIYNYELWAKTSFEVFKAIEGCGGRFQLEGLENLRNSEDPVVIISNHMSTLETIIFPCIIVPMRPATFVVKDNLVKAKIFGPIMRSRGPIVVGRTNSRKDLENVLKKGPELLSKGISIVIFPQATRWAKFLPETFNSLGIKLARRAGVRVIPAAIKTDFWGIGKYLRDLGPLIRKNTIHICFGQEMTIKGNGREEHQRIIEFIQTHLRKWAGN